MKRAAEVGVEEDVGVDEAMPKIAQAAMPKIAQAVGDAALRAATLGLSEEVRLRNGVFWSWPSDIRGQLRVGQVFIPTIGLKMQGK